MGAGIVLGAGALISALLLANKKPKENKKDIDNTFDEMEIIDIPVSIPSSKPSTNYWKGEYPKSVQYNKSKIGNFNAQSFINALLNAIETKNLTTLKQLYSKLNKDRVRLLHNYFLKLNKGKNTIYNYVQFGSFNPAIKQSVINLLTNSGVGKNIKIKL